MHDYLGFRCQLDRAEPADLLRSLLTANGGCRGDLDLVELLRRGSRGIDLCVDDARRLMQSLWNNNWRSHRKSGRKILDINADRPAKVVDPLRLDRERLATAGIDRRIIAGEYDLEVRLRPANCQLV